MASFRRGECVRVPDGRPGRVRAARGGKVHVRVRRRGTKTDEVLAFSAAELKPIDPPAGWMTPDGYRRRTTARRKAG